MRKLWLKFTRRRRLEQDLQAELAFHREMAASHGGFIAFGNATSIEEEARDLWRFVTLENLWRDFVYAVRMLRRSPGFTLSALLSLGLGIGVNTTVFSLGMELLLSEPSVEDAASIVRLNLGGNSHSKETIWRELRAAGVFSDLVGENSNSALNWDNGTETRRLFAVEATENYFQVLGVPLAQGRGWTPADPKEVAVLGHRFWQTRLAGAPNILGSTIRLDGRLYTVIGILPQTHRTLEGYGMTPDVYVPKCLPETMLALYGRLRPGMASRQVWPAILPLALRLDKQFPDHYKYSENSRVIPIAGNQRLKEDHESQTVVLFFFVLLILVGLVLLIACVNVAGLLLARASARRQEIAIRLSLGASRGRLLQQLLVESSLLSLLGASLGFALALLSARSLAAIDLPLPFPIHLQVEADWRVISYAAALGVLAALLSGLVPAWQSVRRNTSGQLRKEERLRGRRILVAAQVAIAFVVLSTAALFLTNLVKVRDLGPGFDVTNTLRAGVYLPPREYVGRQKVEDYTRRVLRELQAIPGTEAAAASVLLPFLDMSTRGGSIQIEGTPAKVPVRMHMNWVTPGYFAALGIPLRQGRYLADTDGQGGHVVVVNEEFARRYLAGRPAVGSVFTWGFNQTRYEIVGVVAGTKNMTAGEDPAPQVFESLWQEGLPRTSIQFVIRTSLPAATQLRALRDAVRSVEPTAGLDVATMASSIGIAFLPSQVGALLMGATGTLGLLLAAIGLYGVLAFNVARRTREIGIRMAIGASRSTVSRLILNDALLMVGIGLLAGLALALLVTRPLAMFLVSGLRTWDPLSFTAAAVFLALAAFAATLVPLRRALAVDPARCLRYE